LTICHNYTFLRVDIPKGKYKGQKLTKLVSNIIAANAPRIKANVPFIVPVKYKIATKIATIIRMILSVEPIFFFILFIVKGLKIFYYFFGDFVNILNSNPPINAPYKVLFKGLDVIAQVPEEQPILA
jgi:hypothetical protein